MLEKSCRFLSDAVGCGGEELEDCIVVWRRALAVRLAMGVALRVRWGLG